MRKCEVVSTLLMLNDSMVLGRGDASDGQNGQDKTGCMTRASCPS